LQRSPKQPTPRSTNRKPRERQVAGPLKLALKHLIFTDKTRAASAANACPERTPSRSASRVLCEVLESNNYHWLVLDEHDDAAGPDVRLNRHVFRAELDNRRAAKPSDSGPRSFENSYAANAPQ
jgi:hypothetical protein